MSLSNKTINFVTKPKLLLLSLGTSLWCFFDYGIFPSASYSYLVPNQADDALHPVNLDQENNQPLKVGQVPIKLPEKNQPATDQSPSTEILSPTFNLNNPPPNPEPIPEFDPVDSNQLNIYRLDSGDAVSINVPLYPEFNTVGTLDNEGNIIMPIMGRISLAGLTISEVESKISSELGTRFIQESPEVLATLTLSRPAQITILGEVVRPGFYGFLAGSPITQVLQTAGGSTKTADLRSIVIRRGLRDGTKLEQKVDLYSALIDGEQLPPVFLQGGDTIIVSQLQPGEDKNYDSSLVARSTLPQQAINVRILFPSDTGTSLRNLVLPSGSTFIDAVASLPVTDSLLVDEDIALLRFDPDTGGIVSQNLDTKEVIQIDSAQNIPLQDEDVIVVSRTLLGKVFNGFNVITRPIRSFLGFRNFFNNFFD